MLSSKTYVAIPPGETIKEMMGDKCISCEEFSAMMGCSKMFIEKLLNGEVPLTSRIASRLEEIFGVEESFWTNLESRFRKTVEKIVEENDSSV